MKMPLNCEYNKYVNFARLAEERYGFSALFQDWSNEDIRASPEAFQKTSSCSAREACPRRCC